jgi:hypothetical protein
VAARRGAAVVEQRAVAVVERRAVAVAEDRVAVAGIINQSSVMFLVACKIWKWREAICGERS